MVQNFVGEGGKRRVGFTITCLLNICDDKKVKLTLFLQQKWLKQIKTTVIV